MAAHKVVRRVFLQFFAKLAKFMAFFPIKLWMWVLLGRIQCSQVTNVEGLSHFGVFIFVLKNFNAFECKLHRLPSYTMHFVHMTTSSLNLCRTAKHDTGGTNSVTFVAH